MYSTVLNVPFIVVGGLRTPRSIFFFSMPICLNLAEWDISYTVEIK